MNTYKYIAVLLAIIFSLTEIKSSVNQDITIDPPLKRIMDSLRIPSKKIYIRIH